VGWRFGIAALVLLLWVPEGAAAAGEPQIGPTWTAAVGTTTAGLRAEVNPNGLATTCQFEYGPTAAYGNTVPCSKDLGSGSSPVTVLSLALVGLSPDTAYHYRVDATNTAGTAQSVDRLFFTEAFATGTTLLDQRGWEMVSPLEKNGGEVQGSGQSFGGGVIQAASDGSALTFSSTSSFGGGAQGAPPVSQYVSRRQTGGWTTENVSPATSSGAFGAEPDGAPFQLFSSDLARALLLTERPCGDDSCPARYALRESAGGAVANSPAAPGLRFVGASPGLGQVVLSTCAALSADATEAPLGPGCDPGKPNLYRWSGGTPTLVNLLPAAIVGTPGAGLAAPAGAVSSDGNRVYWTLNGNLYVREDSVTKQVDEALGGGGTFQTASLSGSVAFFTKAGHLYRYEAPAGTLTDLTPAGEVQGVLGASADGSRVYYLGAAGLFLRDGTVPTKIAAGADASNYPPATGTARVTPDGAHLAFLSKASLTGYDNRDSVSGEPQTEVFLYDAGSGGLTCASCNPTGERPVGASTIPGATVNGKSAAATRTYKPRSLSDDGRRLFFDSGDQLAVADTGKRPDVYEWEAGGAGSCGRATGCLALISLGRNGEGSSFLDASASGSDAFFLTSDSLVASDSGFADVYDARVDGGFAVPGKPIECVGDACQFLPSEPENPAPATLGPSAGNPPLRFPGASKCRKGFVRKHGKCVRKPHRKKHRQGGRR
jgi:hypothetical protein